VRRIGTTTQREPGGGRAGRVAIVLAALATITAPVVWTMLETRAHRPATHPSFDGERYVFPVQDTHDASRTAEAELAVTLLAWRDGRATTADPSLGAPSGASGASPGEAADSVQGLIARTEATLGSVGLTGEWRDIEARRLDDLRPPFLAPIELDGRASMLVVRRIHSGFVFAFEADAGNVLYPYATFVRAWSGPVRTFEPPVPAPELWR